MANENVPTPAPRRSDDQILPFVAWVPIRKRNFVLDLQKKQKNPIFQISEEFVQAIQMFLTDKTNLGSPTKKGRNDKPHVIPYYRFTKLIICHLGRIHNIYQRSTSPYHLAEKDLRLGNLKFFPKGEKDAVFGMPIPNELILNNIRNATYYNAYLEMVAKHNRRVAAENEGKKKPTTANTESTHVGGVTIQKLVAKATRPLQVVEGKGKAIATEEQAAQSLLALHTPKIKSITDQFILQRQTPATERGSTGPSAQLQDNVSTNIVHESSSPVNAETGADSEKTISGGDTEILQINEDQGKDEFMEEDEARPDPEVSRVAFARPNPEPTHEEFIDTVYLDVHASLKLPVDEHVILEEPLSASGTLSSMKSLDDAYTFRDQFLNDKSTKDEPGKLNMDSKVVSIVTIPIHQAFSLVPPLSTPIIDLSPPRPVPATTHEPIFIETTMRTTTTLKPLPPPPQQSTVFNLELQDLPYKIDQTVNPVVKEAVHIALQAPLRDHFRELPEADIKEILHQRMFESSSYKSFPEHVALYEALDASMDQANKDEFLAEIDKSWKRRHDNQDPLHPPPDSDLSKSRRHDSGASRKQSASHSEQPIKDVPIPDNVNVLDSKDTDTASSQVKDQTRLDEADARRRQTSNSKTRLGYRIMPDIKNPLPLKGPSGQVTIQSQYFFNKDLEYLVSGDKGRRSTLSISKLKVAHYLDFGLEELVMSLWIESEQEYNISAAYSISHWWFKRKEFYISRHDAPSDRSKVRSHMRILSVISLKIYVRYEYAFLKEIVLRKADYKEYKISEADFKILHPNDFEDLNIVIKKRIKDLQLGIESYQTKLNLTQPNWDASDFLFKEDYTIVSKPREVIYRDRNDQKKMMQETEVHKFSNGMLNRILENLNHMVKDFRLFKYYLGMTIRIWSEDDRRRSKEFMKVTKRRLKIKRIFRSFKSFVGGRLRDVDYRLIQRTK
uniref:Histone deacetylase 14 n=1 Tax=Tanacetum cinerariifolium TaxID=118510 RepID=A0A6L2LX02_TANCI|nr:hypothetical protein [Tanacetum cinerariifolium]